MTHVQHFSFVHIDHPGVSQILSLFKYLSNSSQFPLISNFTSHDQRHCISNTSKTIQVHLQTRIYITTISHTMVYSTDASKWRAYQFLDPFAAGSFFVCNKINSHFCRPDCDAHPITELHLEIKFVNTANDALQLGFSPCKSCDPMLVPSIDVNLLLLTVKEINAMIGFVPPLLDDDEEKVTETIKENIMCHSAVQRRMSAPVNAFSSKNSNNMKPTTYAVSKNDSEHYRLIDLACRHLALAAALSIFNLSGTSAGGSPRSDDSSSTSSASLKKKGGRKRRGGVLGFKELATKSKLSAWHFHRVFKSIIGLTPKTYGDMCWEFLEKEKEAMDSQEGPVKRHSSTKSLAETAASEAASKYASQATTPVIKEEPYQFDLQESYLTPPQTSLFASPGSGQKRVHADDSMPSAKRHISNMSSPHLSPFNNLKLEDELDTNPSLTMRATSVPNLNTFGAVPNTLFQHLRNFDFFVNREEMPSTDSVFASALSTNGNEQLRIPDDFSTMSISNDISPATIEDISPLNGSAMISPETMPNSDFIFAMGDYQSNHGLSLAVDPIKEEELYPSMDLFPDLFKTGHEYPSDYNLNDPMLSGLAPELMSTIDF